MKVMEVKVIFESDDIQKYQKQISDIFYDFGVTGLQIEEPLEKKNPLDYYREESSFLMRNHAISAYFPMNFYAQKRKETLIQVFEEKFGEDEDRKSTRLNSSHANISYAVFCLKTKKTKL